MNPCTRASHLQSHHNLYKLQVRVACHTGARVIRISPFASTISEGHSSQAPKLGLDMGVSSSRGGASSSPPSGSKRDVPQGRARAPWILHGRGYVFPFYLPRETTVSHSTHEGDSDELVRFLGGVGGFVVSDYRDSPVGPYKELVFVPGMYQYYDNDAARVKKAHSISRIWVDNEKSVVDARANWGIPKEIAEFEWREPSASQAGRVTVRHRSRNGRRGEVIFDMAIQDHYSPVAVPIRTKVPLLPVDFLNWVPLLQIGENHHLLKTTLSLRGWVKPAAMAEKPRVDGALLPSMGALYGISIPSFELQFKEPVKLRGESIHASTQKAQ